MNHRNSHCVYTFVQWTLILILAHKRRRRALSRKKERNVRSIPVRAFETELRMHNETDQVKSLKSSLLE